MKIKNNNRGFTLAELLVVMAIFGVIVAIVIVNFQYGNKNADLKDAAMELIQNIRTLQSWASSGKEVLVCDEASGAEANKPCNDDNDCGGEVNSCSKKLVPRGGYGIKIQDEDEVTFYKLFIDVDECKLCGNVQADFCDKETMTDGKVSLQKNVEIDEILIDESNSFIAAHLVFQPPTGKIYLNAYCSNEQTCASTGICPSGGTLKSYDKLEIILKHTQTNKTQKIEVSTISGKIGLIEQ